MLKITVLQTAHEGDQARKLIPYVRACDVYSSEAHGLSDANAHMLEREWLGLLSAETTRTKASRAIGTFVSGFQVESHRKYTQTELDYVWRNRKPLFFVERWRGESDDPEILNEPVYQGQRMIVEGEGLIADGRVSEGVNKWHKGVKIISGAGDRRDRDIADNVLEAEPRIRDLTSHLRTKDQICLTINLGGSHKIERYLRMPVNIVDLCPSESEDEKCYLERKVYDLVGEGEPLSVLEPLIIRQAKLRA